MAKPPKLTVQLSEDTLAALRALNTPDILAMVREFHETFGASVRDTPGIPSREERRLRWRLMEEEVEELHLATFGNDLVEVADALGDIVYIAFGTAVAYGIDLNAVLAEIHRSNMAKLHPDGTVRRRDDGKVLKPEGWTPPDIAGVLGLPREETR